jgi:Fe-S-cluster containining protein
MNRHERRAAAAAARRGQPTINPTVDPRASAATELHQHIIQAGLELGNETLSKGRSPEILYDLVEGALRLAESFEKRNPRNPTAIACKKGCSHCCSRPVASSAPTVLRIASILRQTLSSEAFASVLARVVRLDEKTHGLPFSMSSRPPQPCALLVDDACSIHVIRPFVCRAWNSADEDDCRRALKEQAVRMRIDLFQRTVFSGAEKGMHAALRAKGLDPVDLEFTAAMRIAMENPDACERWLAGEPVFAGCEARHDADDRYHLPIA